MSAKTSNQNPPEAAKETSGSRSAESSERKEPAKAVEIGGPPGPEPTRYGDWEKKGRCIDF